MARASNGGLNQCLERGDLGFRALLFRCGGWDSGFGGSSFGSWGWGARLCKKIWQNLERPVEGTAIPKPKPWTPKPLQPLKPQTLNFVSGQGVPQDGECLENEEQGLAS